MTLSKTRLIAPGVLLHSVAYLHESDLGCDDQFTPARLPGRADVLRGEGQGVLLMAVDGPATRQSQTSKRGTEQL
jgi:hypothetical protein